MTADSRYGFFVALAAVLMVGIVVRSWGIVVGPSLDLWSDEARWAVRMQTWGLLEFGFRPLGYMWVSRSIGFMENQELALRLLSYLPAVFTLPVLWFAARRIGIGHWPALFLLFLYALHPELIAFAKEFKPYSLEVFVHAGLTLWAIASVDRRQFNWTLGFVAIVALAFCYNAVFLYPWMLLAVAATHWPAHRRPRPRTLLLIGLALVAVAATLHPWVTDALNADAQREYWGTKYRVFPLDLGVSGTLAWYADRTRDLVTWPAALRGVDGLAPFARAVVAIAYASGVVALIVGRRWILLGLLCGPLATALTANALGYWPYGAFRTNLFLLPAALLTIGVGLQWLASLRHARVPVALVSACVVAALWPTDLAYHRYKHVAEDAPSPQLSQTLDEMLARFEAEPAVTTLIVADRHSWRPIHYYLHISKWGRWRFRPLRESTTLVCCNKYDEPAVTLQQIADAQTLARARGETVRVWLVVTKLSEFSSLLSAPLVAAHAVAVREYALDRKSTRLNSSH